MVQKLTKYANSFHIWITVYIIIFLYIYILRMNTFILHQVAAQVLSTHNC